MNEKRKQVYYDWARTRSYNPWAALVVGGRGIGKTFGSRLEALRDFERHEFRTVEIFRSKVEMKKVTAGYFDKLAAETPYGSKWDFRADSSGGYIKTEGGGNWHKVFYWVWLSSYQDAKKQTMLNVKQILFDEFILDRTNAYQRYTPNEFAKVANVVDTVTRQRAGDGQRPILVMCANAIDLVNPYFAALGISKPPAYGYHWYANKKVLLHMVPQSAEAAEAKRTETLAGALLTLAGDEAEARTALENAFTLRGETFVEKGAKVLRPAASIVWRGREFTIWRRLDNVDTLHVREGIAEESKAWGRVFYFSKSDARIDFKAARRADKALKWVGEAFAQGAITFETPALFEQFTEVVNYLGLSL